MVQEKKPRNKILIAEDDSVSRRLLHAFLLKWGFQVIEVGDGLEALHVLESADPPSLALLDWMMPGMEGPAVCQHVREKEGRSYIYILLLTARTQKEDVLHGLESGADDYLTKPFDAQELRARLHVGQRILDLQESLVRAREELRFQATHDVLTGIANRGVAMDALQRERSRQIREGGPFAVILADVDHFKYVNDTYGHLAGDIVLRETARRLSACIRPYDTIGRYGGEEFLSVIPSADEAGALALADRMRQSLEASPFVTDAGNVDVTASFGVAVSHPGTPPETPLLLHLADDALYRAKERGRNRCELANPHAPGVLVAAPSTAAEKTPA